MQTAIAGYRKPPFWKQFLSKVVMLFLTIVLVWIMYAYMHAYRLEWLGWAYSKLTPLTNGLYSLVETYFPADVKFKVRGAITDDLGQRSLFLLMLTAVTELVLFCVFKGIAALYSLATRRDA